MTAFHISNTYGRLLAATDGSVVLSSGETVVFAACAGSGIDEVKGIPSNRLAYA